VHYVFINVVVPFLSPLLQVSREYVFFSRFHDARTIRHLYNTVCPKPTCLELIFALTFFVIFCTEIAQKES
jgi:hypothetical protein